MVESLILTSRPTPEIQDYYVRVVQLRKLYRDEIPLHFNDFLELPLACDTRFTGFMQCPAGIAVTEKRVWVAHLSFEGKEDIIKLWPRYDHIETTKPNFSLVIGSNRERLGRLLRAVADKTRGTRVETIIVPKQKSGLYTLSFTQQESQLFGIFTEEGTPRNQILFSHKTTDR